MKIRRGARHLFFIKEKLITWSNRIAIAIISQTILSIITTNTAITIS